MSDERQKSSFGASRGYERHPHSHSVRSTPDAATAIKRAIEKFQVKEPFVQKRLIAMRLHRTA